MPIPIEAHRSESGSRCVTALALITATALLSLSPHIAIADPAAARPSDPRIADPAPSTQAASASGSPTPWISGSFGGSGSGAPAPDAVKKKENREGYHSGFAVDAALAIEMPIMIGGQLTLEMPYRFLLQGEVGVLPGFSVDAANSILVGSGAYNQSTADLVSNGLKSSLVVRLSGGWRPFPTHGFEVLGGYTLTSLGGGVSARSAVESVAGVSLPSSIPDADVELHTTIHSFHVQLGWRWVIAEHFLIRMNLGYMQAVSSSSHIDVPSSLSSNALVASGLTVANQAIDAKLNDIYTTYVKLPVAGFSMGYRF